MNSTSILISLYTGVCEGLEEIGFLFEFKSIFKVLMLVHYGFGACAVFLPFVFPKFEPFVARTRQCWPIFFQTTYEIRYLYIHIHNIKKKNIA